MGCLSLLLEIVDDDDLFRSIRSEFPSVLVVLSFSFPFSATVSFFFSFPCLSDVFLSLSLSR